MNDCRAPDFVPRVLVADASGQAFVGARGYAVEVLDGGVFGPTNVLQLVRGEDATPAVFADADTVPCVAGTLLVGQFTGIRLQTPAGAPDTVKLRLYTREGAQVVNAAVTGKPRVAWLARGATGALLPGAYLKLWASGDGGEFDRFVSGEPFDVRRALLGWVASDQKLNVYIWAKSNAIGSDWRLVFSTTIGAPPALTGAPPHVTATAFNFTSNGVPLPFPPGSVEVYVQNSGVGATTFVDWVLGAVGV